MRNLTVVILEKTTDASTRSLVQTQGTKICEVWNHETSKSQVWTKETGISQVLIPETTLLHTPRKTREVCPGPECCIGIVCPLMDHGIHYSFELIQLHCFEVQVKPTR